MHAIADPGERKGWGDRDLYAGRATLNAEFLPDSKLALKVFGSRDRGEPQNPDSPGGVSNSGWVEPDNDPYTFYSDRYGKRRMDVWGVNANFSQKLNDALNFDFVTGYQAGKRYVEGEGTGSPLRIFDYNFSDKVKQYSFEARVSHHGDSALNWVLGGYYLHDTVDFRTGLLAADAYRSNIVTDYTQMRESKAVFGQAGIDLTHRLTLTAGLRYTADKATCVGSTFDANPWGTSVAFDNAYDEDNLSGRATLSFKPADGINLWVSAGKGYKAGGFDGSSTFSEAEALPFKSENVWAYEAGTKLSLPSGIYASVDGFYYDSDNLQATSTVNIGGTQTSSNVRTNVAAARMFGVDIAGGATLVDSGPHRITADLGVTLLDSKILDFQSSDAAMVAAYIGNRMPAAPAFSGNAQIAYRYSAEH